MTQQTYYQDFTIEKFGSGQKVDMPKFVKDKWWTRLEKPISKEITRGLVENLQ